MLRRSSVIVSLLLAALGCGGDKDVSIPGPTGGFSVALSSSSLSLEQGASVSVSANITRTGSFSSTVTLALEGAPSGLQATVAPASITTATTAATLTLVAAPSLAPGSYALTLRGSAAGFPDQTVALTVTVTARPAIALTVSPSPLALMQGATGQATLTLLRTNTTAPVTLSSSGAPAGVTVSFAVATLNAETSTAVTVVVGAAVTAGSYPIALTGTAGALTTATTLQLTVDPLRRITLAATPPTLTVERGRSGTSVISMTRTNVTNDISLAIGALPAGVTATVTPAQTSGTTATLQVNVTGSAAPGTFPVTLTATSVGVPAATLDVMVTVVPGSAAVTVSAIPATLTLDQGTSGAWTVSLSRTNFPGDAVLSASGWPTNVTSQWSTTQTTGNTATLTLTIGASAPPGTYPVTIYVTGSGINPDSTIVSLTIRPSTPGTGNVTWNFSGCAVGDQPIWLAAQDGNGVWQRIVPSGASYAFVITSEGGVVYVTQQGADDFHVHFAWGLLAELQSRGTSPCAATAGKTVNGTVASLPAGATAQVSLGSTTTSLTGPATSFALSGVPNGMRDLVASRSAINLSNPLAGLQANALIIRRDLDPAAGSTLPVLDFAGAEAFAPLTRNVTVTGLAGGETVVSTATLHTQNGGTAVLGATVLGGGSGSWPTVPAARLRSSDLHMLGVGASTVAAGATSTRAVLAAMAAPVDRTLALGPALPTPTSTTLATAPYVRTRIQLARQPEYDQLFTLGYGHGGGNAAAAQGSRSVSVLMSGSYLSTAPFDFVFPDLRSVAGWQDTWAPSSTALTYNFSASGWTLGPGGLGTPLLDGVVVRTATRTGSLQP